MLNHNHQQKQTILIDDNCVENKDSAAEA